MQPHTAQNIRVPQNGKHNSTGRSNQPTAGNVFRQKASSSSAQKKYIQSTSIYPTVNQNVLLGHFSTNYATCPLQLQQCQYSTQYYPPMYYPYYLSIAMPQQRAAANPGLGLGLSRTIAMKPGRSSSSQAANLNQGKIPLGAAPLAASTILSVINATTTQPVGVSPLVGIPHYNLQQQPQNPPRTKAKQRSHALQIIHPVTRKNILDDLDDTVKNEATNIISEGSSTTPSSSTFAADVDSPLDIEIGSLIPSSSICVESAVKVPENSKSHADIVQAVETCILQTGKTEDNIKQVTDASTTTTLNSNCVQEALPTNCINQQLPKQKQLKYKKEEYKASKSQLSIQISSDKTISIRKGSKESCTEDYFSASEEDKSTIYNRGKSVKIMQLGVKENLTISQQKQKNIVKSNEQQKHELEQRKTQCSNVNNGTTTKTWTESTDNVLYNNEPAANNNNKKSNNLNKTNNFPTKHNKVDKKKKVKNIGKTKTTAKVPEILIEARISNKGSNKRISSNGELCDEINIVGISPKDEVLNKQKIANSSPKSTTLTNVISCTSSTNNEKTKIEAINDAENSAVGIGKKEENASASSSTMANDAAINAKQPSESLTRYNRQQLMQLRESEASRIMSALAYHDQVGGFGAARTNSSGNGNYQNYIYQHFTSGRASADSDHHNRYSDKKIIYLNLSLNQEVKLKEADNAWRPSVLDKCTDTESDPEQKAQREKEVLIRCVRGILNKLTPEKFEPLVEEVIKLKIDTMDKMEAVMILVFEKAIDEPNFSVSYATLCHRLINEVKSRDKRMESGTKMNLALFRTALLNKTQQEFTQNVTNSNAKEEKLKNIREQISNCEDADEKVELEALLDEEERKIRRRSGGTVRFIGELFKISLLNGNIIKSCIEVLLKEPNNEDMLECLCKLLTTVGQKFEQTNIPKEDGRKYSLNEVIKRMQCLALKNESSKISSRVRFMLQDVIDLRSRNWQSTRNEAPKTMEQIEKEANIEQLSSSYHCMNSIPGGGVSVKYEDRDGSNDGRNYGGRHRQRGDTSSLKRQQGGIVIDGNSQSSDNSNNDVIWHVKTGKGNRSMPLDSNKLVGMSVDMNNKKMGGAALFQWNNASSQPTSTPSNSFTVLSLDSNRISDCDGNRDHSGARNKGSYNKGSMKRDRYDHDSKRLAQTGSTQATRENFSRGSQVGVRGAIGENSSNMQKSSSHSKCQQQMSSSTLSRMNSSKKSAMVVDSISTSDYSLNCDLKHQQHELTPPTSMTPAVFEKLSDSDLKLVKAIVTDIVENAVNSKCIDMATTSRIKEMKETQICGLLNYILTVYLHLPYVGSTCRRNLANNVVYLIEKKYISTEHFRLAYNNFFDLASGLMLDIPKLWLYIFEFTGPLIVKKLITVNDLWNSLICENDLPCFSLKFLETFLQYCTREVGPSFTRKLWRENGIKWTSFMSANDVTKFIQTNKFEYVENDNSQPAIDCKESKEQRHKRIVEHIEQLLKEGSNADSIIDYINGNVIDVDTIFINKLTRTLTSFAIKYSNNYSLDLGCFQEICMPVLLHYLDSKKVLELECLSAIQLLDRNMEQPKGLLEAIFAELNHANVITKDTFKAWYASEGKVK